MRLTRARSESEKTLIVLTWVSPRCFSTILSQTVAEEMVQYDIPSCGNVFQIRLHCFQRAQHAPSAVFDAIGFPAISLKTFSRKYSNFVGLGDFSPKILKR